MLRRDFFAVPAAAAAGVVASCKRLAAATPRTTLRVSVSNRLSMCPFYMAYESGYFADAGFDVDVERVNGSTQALPLLAGGKLDVGFVAFGAATVNAVARGVRVRIVAARELLSPSCGTAGTVFVSRKVFPQGIQSMRQLRGARIGISAQSPTSAFWLDTLLEHEGMRVSDVVVRKMDETQKVAALRAGGLDAIVYMETDVSPELGRLGLAAGPSLASFLPNYQYSYILFGSRLLEGPVETGARFLHAYFRGANDFLNGKTPRFLDEVASQYGLDPKQLRNSCRATFERDGTIRLDDVRLHMQWMAAHGFCPPDVDAATLVDTRFLEAARTMR